MKTKLRSGFKNSFAFFDSKAVLKKTTEAERRVGSRAGAIVMTRARRSIRKRKRTSDAGDAPSSHTGLLRQNIFFGYDGRTRSTVIGPRKLKKGSSAEALEYGGMSRMTGGHTKGERVKIRARPFMGPAFKSARPEITSFWLNSVK